mmetsp:Transcript_16797/g.38666  ORF Transcript_16797/g.38666 Transcript_16797/m.38666 type:complete len:111 (+) Transcript_16797:566-898(+)
MDEQDFNALFASLDVDHNGKVDFMEFCNFLSSCGAEFNEARDRLLANQGQFSVRSEQNFSKAASMISASVSRAHDFDILEEQGEEDEEDDAKPGKSAGAGASIDIGEATS